MPTVDFFVNNGSFICDSYSPLYPIDLGIVKHHVEITGHLVEIHELFLMFRYSLNRLHKEYLLMSSGDILRNKRPANTYNDYISINANIISIISFSRTLVESMESYVNLNLINEDGMPNDYLKYVSNIYDNNFYYRLLIRLRDYSQHGHLPLNKNGNNYYINLRNILETSRYHHNTKIKNEIDLISKEIIENYKNTPTLSLTNTIAEFIVQLLLIYNKFWDSVYNTVKSSTTSLNKVIKNNMQNVINDYFVYDIVDNDAQCISIKDDVLKVLHANEEEANKVLSEYTIELDKLKKGRIMVRISDDKKSIEIN